MFTYAGSDLRGGGHSGFNLGRPPPTIRPESYRTMKRRNRLMRKYDHKKDKNQATPHIHTPDEENEQI
ncbi:MAG: hypothetical protein COA69_13185 [Robiginitomaculum sp.]|nr:MAG: hypothetical protein COA69_13185 [Robiginitomaculum sp.]